MIRFLKGLVLLPVALLVVLLAVANRQAVTFSLDPLSPEPMFSLALPLYALLFAAVAVGILVGGVGAWLGQGGVRARARRNRREAQRWEREADRLRPYAPTHPSTDRVALPALR